MEMFLALIRLVWWTEPYVPRPVTEETGAPGKLVEWTDRTGPARLSVTDHFVRFPLNCWSMHSRGPSAVVYAADCSVPNYWCQSCAPAVKRNPSLPPALVFFFDDYVTTERPPPLPAFAFSLVLLSLHFSFSLCSARWLILNLVLYSQHYFLRVAAPLSTFTFWQTSCHRLDLLSNSSNLAVIFSAVPFSTRHLSHHDRNQGAEFWFSVVLFLAVVFIVNIVVL